MSRKKAIAARSDVCSDCGALWDHRTDRCSWWWCDNGPRLERDPFAAARDDRRRRSKLDANGWRYVPIPDYDPEL